MSAGDIYVKSPAGLSNVPVVTWQTALNTTAINPGEPVKVAAAGSKYALAITDGEGIIGTSVAEIGLATKLSTQTTTADGSVDVQMFMPGVVYAGKAKVAANADTQSEIDALRGKRVIWDLTTGVYTVDTAAADNANNALLIVGGDPTSSTIYFMVRVNITLLGTVL